MADPNARRSLESDAVFRPVLTVACFAALAATVLSHASPGLSLSPDSAFYISAAENLMAGRGLVDYTLVKMTVFPPGTSLGLAALLPITGNANSAFILLNLLAAGVLAVSLTGVLAEMRSSRLTATASTALVAFAPCMHSMFLAALSEPLFIGLTVAFVWAALIWLRRASASATTMVSLVLVGWALCLTRYTGIVIVLPVLLTCALIQRHRRGSRHAVALSVGLFVSIGLAPVSWLYSNFVATGLAAGERLGSADGLLISAARAVQTLYLWLTIVPTRFDNVLAPLALALAGWAVTSGLRYLHRQNRVSFDVSLLMIATALVYVVTVVVLASLTNIDPVGHRLLSPALPLLAVGAVPPVLTLLAQWRTARARLTVGLWGLAALWVAVAVAVNVRTATRALAAEADDRSAILDYCLAYPFEPDAVFLSNHPYSVYLYTGLQPVRTSPRAAAWNSDSPVDDVPATIAYVAGKPAYLVWIGPGSGLSIPPSDLTDIHTSEIATLDDGVLYSVTVTE